MYQYFLETAYVFKTAKLEIWATVITQKLHQHSLACITD